MNKQPQKYTVSRKLKSYLQYVIRLCCAKLFEINLIHYFIAKVTYGTSSNKV